MTTEQIAIGLKSSDPRVALNATVAARKILSRERSPPIDTFIEAGIVPLMVAALEKDDQSKLQFEAAWALTNIASGSSRQTNCVVAAGALPRFINLMSSPDANVREQAVWALGNIVGDGPVLREEAIRQGILQPLMNQVFVAPSVYFLRNVTWVLSNLCRHKNPPPSLEVIEKVVPTLMHLLTADDFEVSGMKQIESAVTVVQGHDRVL